MPQINIVLIVPAAHKATADAICDAYEGGSGTLGARLTTVASIDYAPNGEPTHWACSGWNPADMVAAVLAAGIGAESHTLAGTNYNAIIAAHEPQLHRVVDPE